MKKEHKHIWELLEFTVEPGVIETLWMLVDCRCGKKRRYPIATGSIPGIEQVKEYLLSCVDKINKDNPKTP